MKWIFTLKNFNLNKPALDSAVRNLRPSFWSYRELGWKKPPHKMMG